MIIAVASGKGGTGKTLISTSLALSIAGPVQFLDCDVEEPNAHIFLKPRQLTRKKVLNATNALRLAGLKLLISILLLIRWLAKGAACAFTSVQFELLT